MICSQWQDAVPMQDAVPGTCPSSQKEGMSITQNGRQKFNEQTNVVDPDPH
jgi:hypothetical protein